jgi:two-component system, NtrC family, sensor kinase
MQCPRCQQGNRPSARFCDGCGTPIQGSFEGATFAPSYADVQHSLTDSLEQQTATAEILRVISQSPTDSQPVLDVVARSATRLCTSYDASIFRLDGEILRLVAHHGPVQVPPGFVMPTVRGLAGGRAVLERRPIHVADLQTQTEEFPEGSAIAHEHGFHTLLCVPLLREGAAIGIIALRRIEVQPFTETQIALLQTFADQAVIAIENVRLFNETKEALEQQTATAEVLKVISSSPTDVQPVFDTIAESAVRLCDARYGAVFRFDGDLVHFAAHHNFSAVWLEHMREEYPLRPTRTRISGRVILSGSVVQIPDVALDSEYGSPWAARHGFRSLLAVPILRDGRPIGSIVIYRPEPGPFAETHIALLKTFADQAVIAIENVRLFNETKEALEQQTATSEILRVISQSPTNIQPVLDAVTASAARVCGATDALIMRVEGQDLRRVAHFGPIPLVLPAVRLLTRARVVGRAILECRTIHVHDIVAADAAREYPEALPPEAGPIWRTMLAVPLVREGVAIGAILIRRNEIRPFATKEIQLLETFADQAVIAIENVRLFKELEARNRDLTEALDQQTATGEVLRVISSSPSDAKPVFDAMVLSARRLCDATYSAVYRLEGNVVHLVAHNHDKPEAVNEIGRVWPIPLSSPTSIVVWVIREQTMIHTADVQAHLDFLDSPTLARARALDLRSMLVIPMVREGKSIGAIRVSRTEPTLFSDKQVALLQTFANQAVIAIENVRLFKELEGANRELSVASQHKSEFLANMSHELRTPLNAVIGFSEVLSEGMFGDLNEKQDEYLKDIHASGQHLLSLINDILDLSKIEAGRMELELTDFHLPMALDNALTLVRERAGRRSIALQVSVDERLGEVRADERKIRQVVLNLLSNAIKFTPEGGRIEVGAVPKDGSVEVSVSDTGVGIAPEDQDAIFEEFRQVGTAEKKAEGTGLGLTLCRKFIELHGGKIWVKSQLGAGSTFTFTIPVRQGA